MSNKHIQLKDADNNLLFPKTKGEDVASTKETIEIKGVTIGALSDGDNIPANISLADLLKMLVQKQVPPTYVAPTIGCSITPTIVNYESGTQINNLVVKGTFTQNDAGAMTAMNLFINGTDSGTMTNNSMSVASFNLAEGQTKYQVKATYGEGTIKNDNFGQPYPEGHIAAGTISSNVVTLNGYRKLFYGTGIDMPELNSANIRNLSNSYLNPVQNYSFNISLSVGQKYVIFAYPSNLRDVNQVMYVETNDTGMAQNFTKTLVQVADANGNEKEYKVYTYQMAAPAEAGMTFKVTI